MLPRLESKHNVLLRGLLNTVGLSSKESGRGLYCMSFAAP